MVAGAPAHLAFDFFAIASRESNCGYEVVLGARGFYQVLQKPLSAWKRKRLS
jgi:hypothetical protein